ncbi:carbohydrate ABC transporter permease [Yoonia sediminilitoris]|uniref:Carbohydrate ABC transporter membrane protein 2 (CUT1 family) n=1 Tax=Yoonia sediminilitoris TaxID=1286148 RepID=A0A2T6KPK7_9RHOB|nr:carbohydrate ABC transporter permease [Yoonia sediminilitoris]PUB18503.1 carbohydrate ABC transporter membrane protein 2 (CUT1 family) [Yoonia sediminilitoris]RCW98671.1 carbohydrate ABC transporter membrane protein 2 (CUT1 family) [Yoonia sediminilitoris]
MAKVMSFLTRTRGNGKLHWTDWLTYGYLLLGVLLMFLPVIWLGLSSFKTDAELERFPPRILPMAQETVEVEGYDDPLPLYQITGGDYAGRTLAQIRRIGLNAQMVDPTNPTERLNVNIDDRQAVEHFALATENYSELFARFNFLKFFWNSVFITSVATIIMLTVNAMAAFALSKYQFKGRMVVLGLVIGTLMIPQTVVLVPLFLITKELNMADSLWGVIIPGAATPTGVFLLRQYMLTIPDEILDAARMDKASEWKIFWRIIVPLSAPAIAVLAILAIMWRWNDFLWPLIVLTSTDNFTLQLALNSFQGELNTQWSNLLAMTMLVLLPIACVFVFLQKYIATGIASTGGK